MTETVPTRTVTIPCKDEHWGLRINLIEVTLKWVCPTCGCPRGEKIHHDMRTYDGRHWMYCDGWSNPCGHVDYYGDVRKEVGADRRAAQAETETIFAGSGINVWKGRDEFDAP